jgi:hypothetical protein
MAKPANSPMGNDADIFTIGPTVIDDKQEKMIAAGMRSEFGKWLMAYFQERIEYWQHQLPDGTGVNLAERDKVLQHYIDADNVIREINTWVSNIQSKQNEF